MSSFVAKVKTAIKDFHLEQPGVGPGLNGQHGVNSNDCYTSQSGNRWVENKRVPSTGAGRVSSDIRRASHASGARASSSS
jgi:hypothetical protein